MEFIKAPIYVALTTNVLQMLAPTEKVEIGN